MRGACAQDGGPDVPPDPPWPPAPESGPDPSDEPQPAAAASINHTSIGPERMPTRL